MENEIEVKNNKNLDIHIFFTVNDGYCGYLATTMASILYNSKTNENIHFYIIDSDISDKNKLKLTKLQNIKPFSCEYLTINKEEFNSAPESTLKYVSMETNYRFKTSSLKPNLDKVIFLDADLVVVKSLADFWNTNITDYYMAGVVDQYGNITKPDLDIPEEAIYINTGVVLFNLKKWREDKIEQKLFKNLEEFSNRLRFPDQDVLNITLHKAIKQVSCNWNATPAIQYFDAGNEAESLTDTKVYHWAGPKKPWSSPDIPYAEVFWEYAKMTPYYEEIIYRNFTQKINSSTEKIERKINVLEQAKNYIEQKITQIEFDYFKKPQIAEKVAKTSYVISRIAKRYSRKF